MLRFVLRSAVVTIIWNVILRSRFGFECRQILSHGPLLTLLVSPSDLVRRLAMVAAGVGLHHAGVDSKTFALDQPGSHAGHHDPLEYVAKDVALSEPMQPVLRKGRVVGDLVIEVEPTKPAIRQMQLDFLRQPALRSQTVQEPTINIPINRSRS